MEITTLEPQEAFHRGISEVILALSDPPFVAHRVSWECDSGRVFAYYERPIWLGDRVYVYPPGEGQRYGPVEASWPPSASCLICDWGKELAERIREDAEPQVVMGYPGWEVS